MSLSSIVFASLPSLCVALAMVALMVAIALVRRVVIEKWARIILLIGAVLLGIAAGQPAWNRSVPGSIAVMVDLSPSTRGATFRDRQSLDLRIHQLLGDHPYQLIAFADRNQSLPGGSQLPDLPADRTSFSPPIADAVLLFSDGQFELPAYAPPTYPVIDPALDQPSDAAVTDLSLLGKQVLATVRDNSTTRPIHWTGATPDGNQLATPTASGEVIAALSPGDRWPENDSLTLSLPPPQLAQRWWVGPSSPAGWQSMPTLPTGPADYLQPGAIVLNNIPADALSTEQQRRLVQYVRDLGGALIIVGGDHAFAAGGYDGTSLDDLSPLASSPPQPTMHWMVLIDGSGSMAGDPWKTEVAASTSLLPQLPGSDLLSIGSFSETLNWWTHDTAASTVAKMRLPPLQVQPNGPTNLAAALSQIVSSGGNAMPTQLLLMTDADADLPHPTDLAAAMITKKIRLYLLDLGHGSALPALRLIAQTTGGRVLEQLDAGQWITSANQLLRTAMPDRYQHQILQLIPGPGAVSEWNQTWLKPAAVELLKSSIAPMAARWQAGVGQVISIAYPADASVVQSLAQQIAQSPADPRFDVKWNAGSTLRVTVNAVDHDRYLNDESLTMEMLDPHTESAAPMTMTIPQTAPGLYELSVPAPRSPRFVTVKARSGILRRFAIAGRYPPEFDAIGNNLANLKSLADRTGGSVIKPGPVRPIDFHWPTKQIPLASEFAIAGFVVIGSRLLAGKSLKHGSFSAAGL